jgi:hypothetical protein
MMKRLAACGAPSQFAGGKRSYADTGVAMLLLGSLHDDYSTSLPASKNHHRFPQQTITTRLNNQKLFRHNSIEYSIRKTKEYLAAQP